MLRLAATGGGWITAGGVDGIRERAAVMPDLIAEDLFVFRDREPGVHVARYVLTEAGEAAAAEL